MPSHSSESGVVEHDRIAAEEVVELDRADRRQRRAAADQIFVRRHGQHFDPRVGADFRDAPAHAVRGGGKRDDHLPHAVLLCPSGKAGDRPQHRDVVQHPAVLCRIVVDEAHDAPLPASRELAREARARFAGADDEHRLAERGKRAVQPVLLPDPIREPVAGHHEDQHDRVEEQHAARHDGMQLQHHQHERDQQRAETRGEDDPPQVEQAREAPQAAVKAERDEDRALQRQDPRQHDHHVREIGLAEIEIEADQIHRGPGERGGARSWQRASHALKFWGFVIAVLVSICANDNQCRRKSRRLRATTHRAPASPRPSCREREVRRSAGAGDQSSVEQQSARVPGTHPMQALIVMRLVRLEKVLARNDPPDDGYERVGDERQKNEQRKPSGPMSARDPGESEHRGEKPDRHRSAVAHEYARRRKVRDEKGQRRRCEREDTRRACAACSAAAPYALKPHTAITAARPSLPSMKLKRFADQTIANADEDDEDTVRE